LFNGTQSSAKDDVCDKADAVPFRETPVAYEALDEGKPEIAVFLFAQGFLISYCRQECGSTSLAWIVHFNKTV